jgi:hypothetical protein
MKACGQISEAQVLRSNTSQEKPEWQKSFPAAHGALAGFANLS